MKAIVYTRYGPPEVLQFQEVAKPTPKDHELLINIYATAVNSADWRMRKAQPSAVRFFFGLTKPRKKILGAVFAGEVKEVGKDVTQFQVGDRVFGSLGMSFGAYAEFICIAPEKCSISIMPENMTYEEAAAIPFGGMTALHFLKKANVQRGQNVLIYGASGAVGTAAVQLAKDMGANVTGICSTSNMELVQSLGATNVIDYTREDFTKEGKKYDVIFDTVAKINYKSTIASLTDKGILLLGDASVSTVLNGFWTSGTTRKKVIGGVAAENSKAIEDLKKRIEKGALKAVIDRTYPLEQAAEAHRYVEKGHKKGNVILTIQ
ncbi:MULTISPECIES: NAD(P)-dependent alcohol dehydrogenase [Sutcliffiella]|uniref:NAD(P)-dependent alcohol dehydrogenase n=1 Tax=Sutcliffiella cohnii TaxID=33932 RepID=A0A223KNG5_9BACI|nr:MULTISPECIES: NAD(P)-dependent alcohol dehydrogenase [Sutcliffiella]AST90904.1 NAD(P)-dependent alcohol dehydrogenase [Sutcliffiella cohnii]WBL16690.1 NAD(P)-dependent alcohol dehydrogenase [Sutcliffiella sp. NC1]